MKLSDEFIGRLKLILQTFEAEANEATRTHRIIARLLNEIEDLSSLEYRYVAGETNQDRQRPDFILMHKKREFFIVEAKANLSQKDHIKQITKYLDCHDIKHGSLTDGIQWSMLYRDEKTGNLELDISLYMTDPQAIVDYILSKV